MTDHLTVRIPAELRDADGVRLDAMLTGAGMSVLRELPRVGVPDGCVDLLVEDTTAPAAVRGRVVRPVYDEIDGELSFDRWEPIEGQEVLLWHEPEPGQTATPLVVSISDEDLLAELARRRGLDPAPDG